MEQEGKSNWLHVQIDTGTILREDGHPSDVDFCSAIFYHVEYIKELEGNFYAPVAGVCLSLN